jgi:HK97 gp10 family phage protein
VANGQSTILKDYTTDVLLMAERTALECLKQSAAIVESAARPLCAKETGQMVESLTHQIDQETLTAHIGYTAPYAYYVETGTRPHTIRVKNKKVLYSHRKNVFFGKQVQHPGSKPQPSLVPALMGSMAQIERIFADAAVK